MGVALRSHPRWVRLVGIHVVVVAMLLGALRLAGFDHGPHSHGATDQAEAEQRRESGTHTPPKWVPDRNVPGR